MLFRQSLTKSRGERLTGGAGCFRSGDQRRGRGHREVTGGRADGRGAGSLEQRGAPGMPLDRSLRRWHRPRRWVHLGVFGVPGQCGFVATPGLRLGLEFGGLQDFHREVDGQRRG